MWEDVDDEDFSYFSIEQKEGDVFKEVIKETGVTGCTISGLSPEEEYSFRVCGVDSLGNKGDYSEIVSVNTMADANSPSITAVYPVQGRLKNSIPLSMSVTDNYKAAIGKWSLSFDGELFEEIASIEGNSSAETFEYTLDISDEEKYPEGKIYIKFEAWDEAGNKNQLISDGSDIVMEYIIDRTAPEIIDNVSARAFDGYISVKWDEGSEDDIVAYKVYRAEMEQGIFKKVMDSASLNYFDADIESGESYAYYITAVDEAGNESSKSKVSFATAIPDETGPKVEGVSPNNNKVGKSVDFSIIVTDNSALSYVRTYYKTKDNDTWVMINETSVSGRSAMVSFAADLKNEPEGEIQFKTICEDRNGNISDDYFHKYILDKTPPKADISALGGNFENYVDLKREIFESDISYYEIYRCELSKSGKNTFFFDNAINIEKVTLSMEEDVKGEIGKRCVRFTDTDVVPHTAYRYAAKVYDSVGNYSWTEIVNAIASDIDLVAPTIVTPDKITTIVGMEVLLDGGNCTDNVRIKSFKWDMGNGDVITGARPRYKYTEPGTYDVKLTLSDYAGNLSEKTIEVQVKEESGNGICNLTVVDYSGNPIPYSYVYINSGADSDTTFMTDAYGKISLCYKAGTYKIAAFKEGYLPEEKEYKINNMKISEETIKLSSGEVVVGDFEVHRMSLQEIVDSGVDLSDPANINTFTFKTTLTFQKIPIPVVVEIIEGEYKIDTGDDVKPGGFGTGNKEKDKRKNKFGGPNFNYAINVIDCGGSGGVYSLPVFAILHTTQSISWLKTMYSATLTIINNADSKYVIEDSKGTIVLPDGVSLAVLDEEKKIETGTASGQKLTYDMGDIAGQKSESVSWTLKGDKTGKYDIEAYFNGILTPFNVPVSKSFKAEAVMEVNSADVEITVMPESAAYIGEEYYIQYAITNKGDEPLYNFTTSIGDYEHVKDKSVTYIMDYYSGFITETDINYSGRNFTVSKSEQVYQTPVLSGEDTITIPTLNPGQTIYGTWQYSSDSDGIVFGGDCQKEYFKLIKSLVEVIEGDNLGVNVRVAPIPSHVSKIIRTSYKEEDTYLNIGDPIDLTTGSYTDNVNLMTLIGKNTLSLDLTYDSQLSEYRGECGYGWSNNFESKIIEENGMIFYQLNPSAKVAFISKDSYEGKYYVQNENPNIKDESEVDEVETDESEVDEVETDEGDITESEDFIEINLDEYDISTDISFVSISHGMEGFVLTKHTDGSYTLMAPNGAEYGYDTNGKLISIKMEDGSLTEISHTEHQTIIKEQLSGIRIILNYDDYGNLISVTDDNGRIASVDYNDGKLVSITDVLGNVTHYEYDDSNRIIKSTDTNGNLIIENKYDEIGRTINQIDLSGTVIEISYEDLDDGGTHIMSKIKGDVSDETIEVVTDAKGRAIHHKEKGINTYYEYDELDNLLIEKSDDGTNMRYDYDDNGNLISVNDNNDGAEINLAYSDNGEIEQISTGEDSAQYYYDEAGNLAEGTFKGKTFKYTYDSNNIITSIQLDGKGTKYFESENGRYTGYIDELGNKTSYSYDGVGNIISKTDALGNVSRYEYDDMSHLTKMTDARGNSSVFKYDIFGNMISKEDSLGYITQFEYDAVGRLCKTIYPDGSVYSYEYDKLGNLLKKILPDGSEEKYEYDDRNRIIGINYADGTEEEITYTNDGKINSLTDANGNTTNYEYLYDNLNKIVSSTGLITDISYEDGDITAISSGGVKLNYIYDDKENLVEKTDALGNSFKSEYNIFGEKIADIDANGNKTAYEYDAIGNLVSKSYPNGLKIDMKYNAIGDIEEASVVVDGKKIVTRNEYDEVGNLIASVDEFGNKNFYEYDSENNLISVTNKKGIKTEQYKYDSMGRVIFEKTLTNEIEHIYDINGNLIKTVEKTIGSNSSENVTNYKYDKAGRLLEVIDPSGNITSQTYDNLGNVTSVTDAMGGTTSYIYDSASNLISEKNAIGAVKTYTYDEFGNVNTVTNARGQKTEFVYDSNGRIIKQIDEVGVIFYEYDANGNLIKVSDDNGSIIRKYDSMNRVVECTDVNGRTIKYGYDELGNIISLTYPGGEIVRYSYNLDGTLASVLDEANNKTTYEYDNEGNLIKLTRPDGSVENRTYDDVGNLLEIVDKSSSGALLQSYKYTYDSYGNILSIIEGQINDSVEAQQEVGYSYYMKESSGVGAEDDIEYLDELGEIKYKCTEMKYDESNRLIEYNGIALKYDADGNMIYGPLDGEMVEFNYDARNRLISAGDNKYFYDAENYRYKVENNNYTEEYVTDKVYVISRTLQIIKNKKISDGETSEQSSIVTNYYYGTGLLYDRYQESIRLYHFNHIGNTTLITDKSGNSVYRSAYGTYGELLYIYDVGGSKEVSIKELNNTTTLRFLFNGEVGVITDDNTLLYMRQRYYNTEIKRFINQDVLSGGIENSQSLNRYSYVEGNPVCYTDPFGLSKLVETLRTINSIYNIIQEAISNIDAHTFLDLFGLLPVVGPVFDACNAAYYLYQGDWKNAAMSVLFMLPGCDLVGTAAKISTHLGKFGRYVTNAAKFVKLVGTGTATGVTAYITGTKIANLIDTYATEGKEIDANFFLQVGEICFGIAATSSFGKALASDLQKYTNLEEKLEYAANAIKLEATRVAKDNSGSVKLPGNKIDGDDSNISTSDGSCSSGKSEAGSATEGGSGAKNETGSYVITFESGKKYVGKGSQARMEQSAKYRSKINNDPVVNKVWEPAASNDDAFIDEYLKLKEIGGPKDPNNYNVIESPGKKKYEQKYGNNVKEED
ncbi:MAG: DUF6531 domain-containing protein [Eubacterium sp.]|nr:DUF6531 domain-containing protein [Eubacterium sp.]